MIIKTSGFTRVIQASNSGKELDKESEYSFDGTSGEGFVSKRDRIKGDKFKKTFKLKKEDLAAGKISLEDVLHKFLKKSTKSHKKNKKTGKKSRKKKTGRKSKKNRKKKTSKRKIKKSAK